MLVRVNVPDVAVWSPLGVASSTTPVMLGDRDPGVGTCPVLVNVGVNRTTAPGVVELIFALPTIVSFATSTVAAQRGSAFPAGQLLPAVAEVTVLART